MLIVMGGTAISDGNWFGPLVISFAARIEII
jgi:hypothetical protein